MCPFNLAQAQLLIVQLALLYLLYTVVRGEGREEAVAISWNEDKTCLDWWDILIYLGLEKGLDPSRNLGAVGRKTH